MHPKVLLIDQFVSSFLADHLPGRYRQCNIFDTMQKDKTVVGKPIGFAHPDGAVKNFMSKSTSSCFDHAAHVDACYVFESLGSFLGLLVLIPKSR